VVATLSTGRTDGYQTDIGLSFRQWQRQVRLLAGLIRLAEGQSVTTVAMDVGYDSPSAFIAMFKRALGATPSQYFGAAMFPGSPLPRVSQHQ
jgi:AraC-like DNA-binding protein